MTTTTITPHAQTTIPLTATLTSPFHHGAGSSGNTSILRTQDVIQPGGGVARVPFLSAASVRHGLRDALAWHLANTIDLGTVAKTTVDLLWSGGAVTSTGARTDLDMIRRVEAVFPALGMLGYAARSDIITGTLRASDMILVCAENAWRLPDALRDERRAAAFRTEEFGTRHDQSASPAGRFVDIATADTTSQMIWDTQALAAGANLHGDLSLTPAATPMHRTVLGAALALWAPDGIAHIGGKTAQGYGRVTISGPDFAQATTDLDEWTAHVTENADAIRNLLMDLAS